MTPQLQLHYATTTTTVAVHHTTSSSCGWGDHCNQCNQSSKHNSNHLSVNQWIRSTIRDSQQPTSPIGFLFWNFRHRLVRYYWYHLAPLKLKQIHCPISPTLGSHRSLGVPEIAAHCAVRGANDKVATEYVWDVKGLCNSFGSHRTSNHDLIVW